MPVCHLRAARLQPELLTGHHDPCTAPCHAEVSFPSSSEAGHDPSCRPRSTYGPHAGLHFNDVAVADLPPHVRDGRLAVVPHLKDTPPIRAPQDCPGLLKDCGIVGSRRVLLTPSRLISNQPTVPTHTAGRAGTISCQRPMNAGTGSTALSSGGCWEVDKMTDTPGPASVRTKLVQGPWEQPHLLAPSTPPATSSLYPCPSSASSQLAYAGEREGRTLKSFFTFMPM